jgi:fatty acid CoA ligase FadD9
MATKTLPEAQDMGFVTTRLNELLDTDPQIRALQPDPTLHGRLDPQLGLAQTIDAVMTNYADRPALGRRVKELVTDPATGRRSLRTLERYETLTYGEIWTRSRSLATTWFRDESRPLRANDMLCIIAFSGIECAIVDLAALHNGAVVAPLLLSSPVPQLIGIVKELEPRWMASSLDALDKAVELVLNGHKPLGLLVFDYNPAVDDQRERFEAARARLASADLADLIVTLDDACAQSAELEAAPIFAEPDTAQRLCSIYYTSGSTGLPKGVMYPEYMLAAPAWRLDFDWRKPANIPFIFVHYLPYGHIFGRGILFTAFGSGGTCYFTASDDIATFFEDTKLVRPTYIGLVTRIIDMIHQRYKAEYDRRSPGVTDLDSLKRELIAWVRNEVLGGRVLFAYFGGAPVSLELRSFMEEVLGAPLGENFGATEFTIAMAYDKMMRPPVIDYKLEDVPELGYFKTDKPHPRGEFLLKSKFMMLGYYKRPEETAKAFDDEGYYRTGDVMAEIGPDSLIYVDRRNNVLKLSQGEFVAAARLETLFSRGDSLIRQIYLYATSDRPFLVGVIVPDVGILQNLGIAGDEKAIKAALRDVIMEVAQEEELNGYEVPRDFILEYEPFSIDNGLLTGLGKHQRPRLKEHYSERLEQLFDQIASGQEDEMAALRRDGRNAPVLETVMKAVKASLGIEDLELDRVNVTFSELGGDSLSALTCSLLLEEIYETEVPVALINNPSGSLQLIADAIERSLSDTGRRATAASVHGPGATRLQASDLTLEKFIDDATLKAGHEASAPATSDRTVLVTGANGYLGRFLCLDWLERMQKVGGKVICIARGQDAAAARQRIAQVFESGDPDLKRKFETLAADHLEVLAGDIGEPDLGLDRADWQRLAETVDRIVHPAAFVNHVLPYSQLFGPNVVGTAELIRLAIVHRLKPIVNISTIAVVLVDGGQALGEDGDVRTVTPVVTLSKERYADGYAHSKWAAEVLLREAHDRYDLPVSTFRCDMILAHSEYRGQLNVPDIFTRWLIGVALTGVVPQSFYAGDAARAHYDGLPVDFVARAISEVGASGEGSGLGGYQTYNVANPHDDGISMDSFVDWIEEAGYPITRIADYDEWHSRFETALRALPDKKRQASTLPLLHAFSQPAQVTHGAIVSTERFAAGAGEIPHLSASLLRKYLDDLRALDLL